MRKLFLAMAAVAALLASCSKDDTLTGVSKSKVSFTVSAPELATRYGEGSEATTLYYAVYDAVEGTSYVGGLSNVAGEDFTGGTKEITLALVEGRTYDIIFYAQNAAESPYYVNWEAKTLNINGEYLDSDKQNKVLTANKEAYDAFYAHVDQLKVGNQAINETVYLKRPFAQLNILTNDTDLAAKAGIEIDQSEVTVKNIYTSMNLLNDTVVPESETAVTYAMAAIPGDVVNTDYKWLSMNYLLVNENKLVDVEFKMHDKTVAQNQDAILSRTYTTVAVERNHRTNIYGSIITNPAKFNVEIQAGFLTPDYNVNGSEQYETTVSTAAELQAAIDAAEAGTRTIIKLGQDIVDATAAEIWVVQADDVQIVIDGCGYEFNGSFKVHGFSDYHNATLDFVNIDFKTSTKSLNFIHAVDFGKDSNNKTRRYSQNITVSGCTFEAVSGSEAENTAVALQVNATKNLYVMNCTAINMHSFIQATASDNVTIDGIKVNGKKNGVSLGTSTNNIVRNSNIEVTGYGIRVANKNTTNNVDVTFENNTIKADLPVVARYMDGNDTVVITFKGVNTLIAENAYGYQVVFTAGDDGTYTMPINGTAITLTGAEDYYVYPRDYVDLSQALTGEFTAEGGGNPAIYVSAGVTADDLNTVELEEGAPVPAVVVKDATVKGDVGIDCDSTLATIYAENVVFDCTTAIDAPINATVVAIGCDFIVPEGGKICTPANGQFFVKDCKINGQPATASEISALCGGLTVMGI